MPKTFRLAEVDLSLEDFGVNLVEDIRARLKTKGVTFGSQDSKLAARTRYRIEEKNGSTHFLLIMPDYAEYIDKGRRKTTKGRPVKGEQGQVWKAVETWVKRKGIVGGSRIYKEMKGRDRFNRAARQLSFLISRKIHKKGFKGTGFYSEIINDGRVKDLTKKLSEILKKEVIVDIK